MIALAFLALLIFALLCNSSQTASEKWVRITASFCFSYLLLGFSIVFWALFFGLKISVSIYLTNFSILFLAVILIILGKQNRFIDSIRTLYHSYSSMPMEIKGFLCILLLCSIGPITHADAIDYHLGHPFKSFQLDKLFFDGSYSFGWMGFTDWAHVFFLMEGNSWLIRLCGALMFVPVACFLYENRTSKWIILIILSVPVLFQWISIGKPHIIYDVTLALAFLSFQNNKTIQNLRVLLITGVLIVSIKITALISLLPICLILGISYLRDPFAYLKKLKSFDLIIISLSLMITSLSFYYRWEFYENPFYPLFPEFFQPERSDLIALKKSLFAYQRPIFFTLKPGEIVNFIGPITGLICIYSTIKVISTRKFFEEHIIAVIIFLLVFFLAQKRADYLFVPLILTLSTLKLERLETKAVKFMALTQVTMTTIALLFLLTQTAQIFLNYDKNMRQYAYGYDMATEMASYEEPILFLTRAPNLFIKYKSIDRANYYRCLLENSSDLCLKEYNVKTIMFPIEEQESWGFKYKNIIDNPSYKCMENKKFKLGVRNPFNKRLIHFKVCEKIE